MDANIGSTAGIVALASFALKETFAFVKPLLVRKNGNGVSDVYWEKVVGMLTEHGRKVDEMKDRYGDLLNELIQEQRKLNEYLLRQSVREEMRDHKGRGEPL